MISILLYDAISMASKHWSQHYQIAALHPTCHDHLCCTSGAVAGFSQSDDGQVIRASAGQVWDDAGAAAAITALTHHRLSCAILCPGAVSHCTGTHLPAHVQPSGLAVQLRGHNLRGAGGCGDTTAHKGFKVVLLVTKHQ